MNVVSNIPGPNMPVVGPDGRMAPAWYQVFATLIARTGGSQGISASDLNTEISEDSGVEEVKLQIANLRDVAGLLPVAVPAPVSDDQTPPPLPAPPADTPHGRVEALEAIVQRLQTEIEAIKQGQQL